MIRDDRDFAFVRKQMGLIEDALLSLRNDVLPKNARNYAILSEGYVDQIATLRMELDAYLGLNLLGSTGASSDNGVADEVDVAVAAVH